MKEADSDLDSTLVKYADFNEEASQSITNKEYEPLFGSGRDGTGPHSVTKKRPFDEVDSDEKGHLLHNLVSKRERSRNYAPPVSQMGYDGPPGGYNYPNQAHPHQPAQAFEGGAHLQPAHVTHYFDPMQGNGNRNEPPHGYEYDRNYPGPYPGQPPHEHHGFQRFMPHEPPFYNPNSEEGNYPPHHPAHQHQHQQHQHPHQHQQHHHSPSSPSPQHHQQQPHHQHHPMPHQHQQTPSQHQSPQHSQFHQPSLHQPLHHPHPEQLRHEHKQEQQQKPQSTYANETDHSRSDSEQRHPKQNTEHRQQTGPYNNAGRELLIREALPVDPPTRAEVALITTTRPFEEQSENPESHSSPRKGLTERSHFQAVPPEERKPEKGELPQTRPESDVGERNLPTLSIAIPARNSQVAAPPYSPSTFCPSLPLPTSLHVGTPNPHKFTTFLPSPRSPTTPVSPFLRYPYDPFHASSRLESAFQPAGPNTPNNNTNNNAGTTENLDDGLF